MASYHGEEKCAPETWTTLAGDARNEVLVFTKVQLPNPDEMYEELEDCVYSATNELVRSVSIDTMEKIVSEGPWEIHTNDQATLLLYKLWYDSITLRMGKKPQVTVYSELKPIGMPNHWLHVEVICIDDQEDPMPAQPAQPAQAQPAQPAQAQPAQPAQAQPAKLPWYHPNWVPEVPFAGQPVRWSSRKFSKGVNKLTYDNKGQYETNTLVAKQVWEDLKGF
jgi:hypothetical protein